SKKIRNYGVKIFGGRSFRLENFLYNEGDQIVGLELNLTEPGENNHSTHYKVGVQQNISEVKRTSLNWAASSLRLGKLWTSAEWQFNTIGSYIYENNELDKLQLKLKGIFQKGTTLRMGYEYFTPDKISESFRDQFFHYYAFGKEEIYWGAIHVQTNRRLELFCKIRQISHEKVQPGYRFNSGAKWKSFQGWNLKANFEQINLGTEQASTLFVNYSKSVTPRNLFFLEGVTQYQVNKITGKNQGNGVQVKLKTMFSNRLYLTSSLMAIRNSNLDDEHRLSLKLSWITNH
ncbi:MAG: hypothetical protein GY786_10780, partial [Proteobacteria bacterium]|nr:hypothetical protein [Pseudomonadota bacterium]